MCDKGDTSRTSKRKRTTSQTRTTQWKSCGTQATEERLPVATIDGEEVICPFCQGDLTTWLDDLLGDEDSGDESDLELESLDGDVDINES